MSNGIAMNEIQNHYQNLLAEHYSWMFGSFDDEVTRQREILTRMGAQNTSGLAIDLGSGSGFQTFALAELGYQPIIAVDSSAALLQELRERRRVEKIETREADLREIANTAGKATASVISCMGDTLAHLPTAEDVEKLIADCASILAPGGQLFLSFRDLSQPLSGLDCFIPVRADHDRIMTCALDFKATHVVVTDLIYVRQGESWSFNKSQYRKLRLAPSQIEAWVRQAGLEITFAGPIGRLVGIAATRR